MLTSWQHFMILRLPMYSLYDKHEYNTLHLHSYVFVFSLFLLISLDNTSQLSVVLHCNLQQLF